MAHGDTRRATDAGDALGLVGPDVGLQLQAPLVRRRVDRRPVAARALGDLQPRGDRGRIGDRRPLPRLDELQRADGVAERGAADDVAEALDVEVEPGARADLEQADRQPVTLGEPEQPAVERHAAAGLVGLHGAVRELADAVGVLGDRALRDRPGAVRRRVAAGAREEAGELRCAAAEHDVMQRGEQPQLRDGAGRQRVAREDRGDDPAGVRVVARAAHELDVQPRPPVALELGGARAKRVARTITAARTAADRGPRRRSRRRPRRAATRSGQVADDHAGVGEPGPRRGGSASFHETSVVRSRAATSRPRSASASASCSASAAARSCTAAQPAPPSTSSAASAAALVSALCADAS